MSTTVLAPSGLEITSNHEDGQDMLDSLTKTPDKTPRVLIEKGQPVKDEPEAEEKDETSLAASVLGKKGGKAAAEARKAEAKAKPAEEKPEAKEAKPGDEKGKDEKPGEAKADPDKAADADEAAAGKDKKGNPRHDPEARVEKLKADIADLARQKREMREEIEAEARRAPAARQDAPAAADKREPVQARTSAPADDPEPDLSTYDGEGAYERYVKDTSRWAARDENRQIQTRQRETEAHRRVAETISTHVDTFHERVTGIKKGEAGQTEGFGEFMASLPDALVSKLTPSFMIPRGEDGRPVVQPGPANLITDLIVKSAAPREILEHFADNMDDYQRIAALQDPLQIAGEMAILSHRLAAVTADTSSRREVSRAGSPGRSVPGSPRAAEPNLTSDMDFDEFKRRKAAAQK